MRNINKGLSDYIWNVQKAIHAGSVDFTRAHRHLDLMVSIRRNMELSQRNMRLLQLENDMLRDKVIKKEREVEGYHKMMQSFDFDKDMQTAIKVLTKSILGSS